MVAPRPSHQSRMDRMSKSTVKGAAPAVEGAVPVKAVRGGAAARRRVPGAPKPTPHDENLRFWNQLKRTDPRATKPFTRAGGFRGTQIDPTWRLQIMTETFGPIGKGWGYEQLDWTIAERMVFVCVRVWWRDPEDGEIRWTGPQWGGTEM